MFKVPLEISDSKALKALGSVKLWGLVYNPALVNIILEKELYICPPKLCYVCVYGCHTGFYQFNHLIALTHQPHLLLAPCVHHETSQFSTVSLNICHSEK